MFFILTPDACSFPLTPDACSFPLTPDFCLSNSRWRERDMKWDLYAPLRMHEPQSLRKTRLRCATHLLPLRSSGSEQVTREHLSGNRS